MYTRYESNKENYVFEDKFHPHKFRIIQEKIQRISHFSKAFGCN